MPSRLSLAPRSRPISPPPLPHPPPTGKRCTHCKGDGTVANPDCEDHCCSQARCTHCKRDGTVANPECPNHCSPHAVVGELCKFIFTIV